MRDVHHLLHVERILSDVSDTKGLAPFSSFWPMHVGAFSGYINRCENRNQRLAGSPKHHLSAKGQAGEASRPGLRFKFIDIRVPPTQEKVSYETHTYESSNNCPFCICSVLPEHIGRIGNYVHVLIHGRLEGDKVLVTKPSGDDHSLG